MVNIVSTADAMHAIRQLLVYQPVIGVDNLCTQLPHLVSASDREHKVSQL